MTIYSSSTLLLFVKCFLILQICVLFLLNSSVKLNTTNTNTPINGRATRELVPSTGDLKGKINTSSSTQMSERVANKGHNIQNSKQILVSGSLNSAGKHKVSHFHTSTNDKVIKHRDNHNTDTVVFDFVYKDIQSILMIDSSDG